MPRVIEIRTWMQVKKERKWTWAPRSEHAAEWKVSRPRNRGNQDSQIVLAVLFQKATLDEGMPELDFESFSGIYNVTRIPFGLLKIELVMNPISIKEPCTVSRQHPGCSEDAQFEINWDQRIIHSRHWRSSTWRVWHAGENVQTWKIWVKSHCSYTPGGMRAMGDEEGEGREEKSGRLQVKLLRKATSKSHLPC